MAAAQHGALLFPWLWEREKRARRLGVPRHLELSESCSRGRGIAISGIWNVEFQDLAANATETVGKDFACVLRTRQRKTDLNETLTKV